MPRKSVDIKLTNYPVKEMGLRHPFPAFQRGQVQAKSANGSRDWFLVGFGTTPRGAFFQGSLEPIFSRLSFFIDYMMLPIPFSLGAAAPYEKYNDRLPNVQITKPKYSTEIPYHTIFHFLDTSYNLCPLYHIPISVQAKMGT